MSRRVVISGIGALSGLGVGIDALWAGLLEGRSAIGPITLFDAAGSRSRLGAEIAGFAGAKDYVPKNYRKAVKVMARDIEIAVAAAKIAVDDAKLITRGTLPEGSGDATTYAPGRLGCQIGAGLIAAEADELAAALVTAATADRRAVDLRTWGSEDGGKGAMNNLPPLWMLKYLPNMLACHVTIIHGAEGPSNTITANEASGLLSIGESLRVIQRGDADACFSGGAESPINIFRHFRMEAVHRLADTTGDAAMKPYDPRSAGGLSGEGGGILILEERDAALARGMKPYAEIKGFGSAQSQPTDDCWLRGGLDVDVDEGLQYAIENALDDAELTLADIDVIIPHASGIPAMDRGEMGALRTVFGARLNQLPLVQLTPSIGECLAGAGGLGVAVAAMICRDQRVPGTGPRPVRHVLVCTNALGGQNAAAIVGV